MADLTHAKLAHQKLTGAESLNFTDPALATRAIVAQAYATLACADALDRIATVLEALDDADDLADPDRCPSGESHDFGSFQSYPTCIKCSYVRTMPET